VFSAINSFSEPLELQDLVDNFTTHSAPGLLDDCRRSKQEFAIARGYMLCVKLLAILSEKLLESLLSRPAQSKSNPANSVQPTITQNDGSIRPGLKLSDLYARSPSFKHALNNSTAVLRTSSAALGRSKALCRYLLISGAVCIRLRTAMQIASWIQIGARLQRDRNYR
jgi:hypothetical protein